MDNHLGTNSVDSEDEYDWEEVEVPEAHPQTIEIVLQTHPKPEAEKKKKGISHAERLLRIDCHKIHTVALLANAWYRNQWLNDELLHGRLLSICPLKLQNTLATIHKSRIPDQNQRGRMFENAIRDLTDWWSNSFEIVPEGHLRNRTFHDVEKILERYRLLANDDDSTNAEMELEALQDVLDEDGELIRSPKSLMKHVLMASGSRDTSAQLFTALCRALAIPARLVVSIQSVPWQASVGKPKPKYEKKGQRKGKNKVTNADNTPQTFENGGSENDEDMEEVEAPSASSSTHVLKGKAKAARFPGGGQRLDGGSTLDKGKGKEKASPAVKLRKPRPKGRTLGSASPSTSEASLPPPDPTTNPPVFWTEVFSRPDGRWLPVDPIRNIVNKRKVFDPTPVANPSPNVAVAHFSRFNSPAPIKKPTRSPLNQENRLVYVLAFEEDGYARDVTRRYAREFGAKVAKVQGGSGAANAGNGGKGRLAWWNRVLNIVQRPYRLNRDDIEDDELETAQMLEGMPTTVTGFKDHPVYVLTRHLKQNETIHPPPPVTPELGKFRGEPVYPKSAVVSLKTAENWMRNEGRTVKAGEQPLKTVKVRAGTVNKMRELEVLKEAGTSGEGGVGGEVMQGLYARSQTEPYVPDPIIDGVVPKNNFGNIDLYVPSMLPRGGVHIPYKGVAKIARKLGFDFAEAVTGFEFKKRRAFPVIEGIVVAKENEATLLEAFWESERVAEEKARAKREERVIKQWTRLIQGLRIRQRLQEQYGTKPDQLHGNDDKIKGKGKGKEKEEEEDLRTEAEKHMPEETSQRGHGGGGFLVGADDVVQAFHLPKFQHVPNEPVMPGPGSGSDSRRRRLSGAGLDYDGRGRGDSTLAREMELEEVAPTSDAPEFITYDLDEMAVDTNSEVGGEHASVHEFVPKTMAQLAEDAAATAGRHQQEQLHSPSTSSRSHSIRQPHSDQPGDDNEADGNGDGGENEHGQKPDSDADEPRSDNGTGRRDKAAPAVVRKAGGASERTAGFPSHKGVDTTLKLNLSRRAKVSPDKQASAKKGRTTSRQRAGRKRTRQKEVDEDSNLDENDDEEIQEDTSPKKRTRTRAAMGAPLTSDTTTRPTSSVSTPTRTLRPRTSKSTAQVEEEKQLEAAYQEATSR